MTDWQTVAAESTLPATLARAGARTAEKHKKFPTFEGLTVGTALALRSPDQ